MEAAVTVFKDFTPPLAPAPPDDTGGDQLYDAYRKHTLRVQELREQRHAALAEQLRKDIYWDHSGFLDELRAERGKRYLLSRDEFHAWWSSLSSDQQAELSDLYDRPVEETLDELRSAFREAFEDRQPEPWQADS